MWSHLVIMREFCAEKYTQVWRRRFIKSRWVTLSKVVGYISQVGVRLRNDGQCVILPQLFSPENLFAIRITLYFKQLQIYLDEQQNIKTTECECPRGAFKCSHAAALFIHGIYHLSRTDVECQWRKRKSNTSLSNQAVSELFPPPKNYCALPRFQWKLLCSEMVVY